MKKFPIIDRATASDCPNQTTTKESFKQAQHFLEEQSSPMMFIGSGRHAGPVQYKSPCRLPQHAAFNPSQESYTPATFPRPIPQSYYRQDTNSWFPHQRAMMVDHMQTPYRDGIQLQQQDPRRELQDLLMLEVMLASRHEIQARLALARLSDRRLGHAGLHHEIGRLPMFPTSPPPRRLEESGLRMLSTAAVLHHSGATVAGNDVTSPQPRVGQQSLAARLSSDCIVAETRSDSGSREPPSAPSSPSSQGDEATRDTSASPFQGRTYVDSLQDLDILCGRGGKSNHNTGNKKYRHVVGFMKLRYQHCSGKTQKTDLSRQIVDYCVSYGARFLKQDIENGKYYILSKDEARRKTSQALREPKMLKWTTT